MPNHYVSDYEALTGLKPEPGSDETPEVEAKVVEAPAKPAAKKAAAKVETK